MAEQGLTFVSGNYTAGPGISAPSKVFGPEQVAELTNNRLDQYVQDKKQEQAKNQAKLAKMLSDLDVKPTGMFEKDLPEFVKSKQALEDFYTQAQVAGVDPNNPRFIEQYTKAKKYKDGLQAMVQQSVNNNKEFIEATKKLDNNKNDQFDFDASQKNLESFKNGTFDDRNKLVGNLLVPNTHDYEGEMIGKLLKEEKPTEFSERPLKTPIAYDKNKFGIYSDKVKRGEKLTADENAEYKDMVEARDTNAKIKAGYDVTEKQKGYGENIEFSAKDVYGNEHTMFKIPERDLEFAKLVAADDKAGKKAKGQLENLRQGKDMSGRMAYVKDGQGNDTDQPDPAFVKNNQDQYNTLVSMAAGYHPGGQTLDAVELIIAQKIEQHTGISSRLITDKTSEDQKKRLGLLYSKYWQEQQDKKTYAESFAERVYGWFTGDPKYVHFSALDNTLQADLVGHNSYLGAEYDAKKHVGNNVGKAEFIRMAGGETMLRVQTPRSLAEAQKNSQASGRAADLIKTMKDLQSNTDFYDGASYQWKKTKDAVEAKKSYDNAQQALEQLDKQGGTGYETYTMAEAKQLGEAYLTGTMRGHGDLTSELSAFDKVWDDKFSKKPFREYQKDEYKSPDKEALKKQLEENKQLMNDLPAGSYLDNMKLENEDIQKKIDNIDVAQGNKEATKVMSLADAKRLNPKFKGTDDELKAEYKKRGYNVR